MVEQLTQQLARRTSLLIGCQRRNVMTASKEGEFTLPPWTMISGNAYLDMAGWSQTVKTPIDYMAVWIRDNTIIEFRGGPVRDWWWDDLNEIWTLTKVYSSYELDPYVMLLNENKGVLQCLRARVHQFILDDPKGYAADILEEYVEGPARLAKNSQRAYHVCRTCPTKRQCDITDRITPGGTNDWGDRYPFP